MNDMTYQEAIKNVEHLRAIGETTIWLRDDAQKPWKYVTSCQEGGSHRLEISTSVWFEALEPKTNLKFRWSFDIEPRSANGKGNYEIDTQSCENVMKELPIAARKMFKDYLANCAAKVLAKANEWKMITDRQFQDARTLDVLAKE